MTTAPATAGQPETASAAGPDAVRPPGPSRRELWGWAVLLPVSVLAALLVLHFMAAAAASATGGCGGG